MAIQTPTITPNVNDGNISISFDNTGTAPAFNLLQRDGIYISRTIPDDSPDPDLAVFFDYQTRSGQQVSYIGSCVDGSGNESFPTAPITATLTLSSVWLHQVAKNANGNIDTNLAALELINPGPQRQTFTREANVLRLAASEKPRILTAPQVARIIECPIIVLNQDRSTVMPILEQYLWSDELFCYRDPDGELMFCTIGNQETSTDLNVTMTLILTESSYSEAVNA